MFTRPFVLDRIEFRWDGEKITFPGNLAYGAEKINDAFEKFGFINRPNDDVGHGMFQWIKEPFTKED